MDLLLSNVRHGNHGGTVSGVMRELENTANDEQKRNHKGTTVHEQRTTADSFGSVEADGDKSDKNTIDSDGGHEGICNAGLLEEEGRIREKNRGSVPELIVKRDEGYDSSALNSRVRNNLFEHGYNPYR